MEKNNEITKKFSDTKDESSPAKAISILIRFFLSHRFFFKKPRTNSKHILSEIGIELANLENGGSETMKSKLIFLILKLILMFVEIVKAIVEMIK
ncbi:hypothetical protein LEP1GSC021_4549 [Leptospira noguchii str. 1993005606]|nr:hypothetical protein LEP1GSC021_4549 [Leptospira noguchii str. 1993005606]